MLTFVEWHSNYLPYRASPVQRPRRYIGLKHQRHSAMHALHSDECINTMGRGDNAAALS